MLLRASRSAERLTKEAFITPAFRAVGRFAAGVGRGLAKSPVKSVGLSGKMGRGVGGTVRRYWKPMAGTAFVGAMAAPQISQGLQKARVGLSPQFIQAQNRGMAPMLRARF